MSDDNAATIERFYAAFARHDGAAMEACYAAQIHFRDPVFGDLHGPEAGAMWRMLTSQADDLEVELASHDADAGRGRANWIATYTFSRSGRKVVNDIEATFRFDEAGLITEHFDHFDFYKWTRQALGLPGLLLGWTPIVQNSVRKQARTSLDEFRANEEV